MSADPTVLNETPVKTPRTIFVIDDEEYIRKVLKTHLTKEGFDVVDSSGGPDVLRELDNASYDIVICDLRMPGMDGSKIVEFVRKRYDTRQIIVLSGLSDVTTAVDVMKKGAFDFIMKPVKKAELLGTIERALSHKDLLERNKQLEKENREYQLYLEDKVRERTKELSAKTEELKEAYRLLKVTNIQVVKVLAETIEAKDPYTKGHCDRMRTLSGRIATLLNMTDEEREILDYATILHDLGKVGVHETVLNKNSRLSDDEFEHVKRHSLIGERILDGISLMGAAARVVGAHHEKYDGTGYPRGLRDKDIPLHSRIIAVVDTFDAMRSDRPYRSALPMANILDEMQRVAGSQLDPAIVKLFLDERLYL